MNAAQLTLLVLSALVVFAASVGTLAALTGRRARIPGPIQGAIVPSAETKGMWERRVEIAISVMFCLVSQGLLVVFLLTSNHLGAPAILLVGAEFVVAFLIVAYVTWIPRKRSSPG